MASRMERYYKSEERTKKNEHLYQQISELSNYSNIEGVADISNSNEINITMVRDMLKSREEFQKTRNYDDLLNPKKEVNPITEEEKEEKNYDIRDILNKAKIDHSDSDIKYRNLQDSQYEILKNIKIDNSQEDLSTFVNKPINNTSTSDDLGIFDNLKSDTMVGDASSIKKIIDEAKKLEETREETKDNVSSTSNVANIDNTFYTSSFSFSDKDFEDLKKLDSNIKRNNKLMKILIIIFSIVATVLVIFMIAKLIF